MFGYSMDELIGSDVIDLYANPDDRETLLKEIAEKETIQNRPLSMKRKDASRFGVYISARATAGRILGSMAYAGGIPSLTLPLPE